MKLTIRSIEAREIESLLAFYERLYGKRSYQASRRYVDWLYGQNPASRGLEDCLLALAGNTIVGCVHRMRLPCAGHDGTTTTLASLQNHVVAPSLRGGGGVMLLQRAVKSEQLTFSPGVAGRLREAYRRLGYIELPSYWFVRVLRPLLVGWQAAARTLSRGSWPRATLRIRRSTIERAGRRSALVTLDPTDFQLARVAQNMLTQSRAHTGMHVTWNSDLLRWRYFSRTGPRHVLIESPISCAWAILSYGVKARVNVVRLVEYDGAGDRAFMMNVLGIAQRLGACVALAYTTRKEAADELIATGWRLRTDPPASFFKGAGLSVSAAATDVGFEALLTEEQQ